MASKPSPGPRDFWRISSGLGRRSGFRVSICPTSSRRKAEYVAGTGGTGALMIFCTRPGMLGASKGTFRAQSLEAPSFQLAFPKT